MTQRVSKRGRVYTEGSQTVLDGYPRVCAGCGQSVRISSPIGEPNWFETVSGGAKMSWHFDCRLRDLHGRA